MKKLILILSLFVSLNTFSAETIRECEGKHVWKTIGVGALYGGGISLAAAGLTVVLAPSGTVVAPTSYVVGSTVGGAVLGGGSSAAAVLYIESKTEEGIFRMYCARKAFSALTKKGVGKAKTAIKGVSAKTQALWDETDKMQAELDAKLAAYMKSF